jgi:hypothetical protein
MHRLAHRLLIIERRHVAQRRELLAWQQWHTTKPLPPDEEAYRQRIFAALERVSARFPDYHGDGEAPLELRRARHDELWPLLRGGSGVMRCEFCGGGPCHVGDADRPGVMP